MVVVVVMMMVVMMMMMMMTMMMTMMMKKMMMMMTTTTTTTLTDTHPHTPTHTQHLHAVVQAGAQHTLPLLLRQTVADAHQLHTQRVEHPSQLLRPRTGTRVRGG